MLKTIIGILLVFAIMFAVYKKLMNMNANDYAALMHRMPMLLFCTAATIATVFIIVNAF